MFSTEKRTLTVIKDMNQKTFHDSSNDSCGWQPHNAFNKMHEFNDFFIRYNICQYHQWMTCLLKTPTSNKFTYYSILSRADCKDATN
jgi:hypothetical protein